jgi:GNAT superfamily N-acetyltransferase
MRIVTKKELPAVCRLWQTCFGDSEETVYDFFDSFFGSCTVFASEELTAMAVSLPVRWLGKDAAYLYAVCTDPAYRGRGLCRRLMGEAEAELKARGCSFAALVPGEESLFRFYESLGYQTCFFCRHQTFPAGDSAPVLPVSPARYASLRAAFPESGVQYDEKFLAYQAKDGLLLELPGLGCAAAERRKTGWALAELLSPQPEKAAGAVCAFLGCEKLPARLPGAAPFGMAKSLDGSAPISSYLAFPLA